MHRPRLSSLQKWFDSLSEFPGKKFVRGAKATHSVLLLPEPKLSLVTVDAVLHSIQKFCVPHVTLSIGRL